MQSEFTAVHLGKLAIFEMGQSPPSAYVSEEEIGLPFSKVMRSSVPYTQPQVTTAHSPKSYASLAMC